MSEPIDELSNFEPGVPVNPMPAAEVRRRGERLRRRNAALVVGGAALAVALVATPIAVFAGGDGGGQHTPGPARLTSDVLLTTEEVPARERLTEWRESAEQEGEVLACAPQLNSLSDDADAWVRRDFEADVADAPPDEIPVSVVRTAVLQFSDESAARDEYDRVQGWIFGCPAGDDLAAKGVSAHAVDVEGGHGEVRRHDFFAPDICTECDAIRFDHMGVAQFDDRLVLVSFAEVGGPLEPEGLDATMDELFQAAVTKAGGAITGGSGTGTIAPPDSSDLVGFPLASGMPDGSGNSDYQFDPPSIDNEAMIPAGELTVCGNTPPDTAPLDRLTTRLTGPSDAQVRELQLLHDDQEAVTYVAHLRNLYQSCPTSDSGGAPPTFTTTVGEGALGEESLDIRRASDGVGRVAITVVRIGNAVLVENVNDEGEGAEVDSLATAARENLADVIAAMNELQGGSATDSSAPEATPAQPTTAGPRIPDEFPLATGWPEPGGDSEITGPRRGGDLREFSPCDVVTPDAAHADRMRADYRAPEDYRTRQLTTYADADAAVGAVASFVDAFRACPEDEVEDEVGVAGYVTSYAVQRLDVGGESWAVLARDTVDGSPSAFGETTIIIRVGSAVLVLDHGGHAGYPSGDGRAGIEELLEEASVPIAEMCIFTDAGC